MCLGCEQALEAMGTLRRRRELLHGVLPSRLLPAPGTSRRCHALADSPSLGRTVLYVGTAELLNPGRGQPDRRVRLALPGSMLGTDAVGVPHRARREICAVCRLCQVGSRQARVGPCRVSHTDHHRRASRTRCIAFGVGSSNPSGHHSGTGGHRTHSGPGAALAARRPPRVRGRTGADTRPSARAPGVVIATSTAGLRSWRSLVPLHNRTTTRGGIVGRRSEHESHERTACCRELDAWPIAHAHPMKAWHACSHKPNGHVLSSRSSSTAWAPKPG